MKFVKINEKNQPISFNMAAFLECEEELGIPITTLLTQYDSIHPSKYMKLAYMGLKFGCDEYERKPPLTYSAFVEYVRDNQDVLTEIMQIVFKDLEKVLVIETEAIRMVTETKEDAPAKKKKPSGRSTSGA